MLGNNENIVRLHDVFDSRSKLCLVLDLLSGGELFDRIIEKGHFNEKLAAAAFRQMAEALSFMHNLKIVHRDLKPENLLFASKEPGAPLKLIDFGLAGSCADGPLKTPCGTPNYVAPEILRRQPYATQVDMWSAGVILYIILCGFPPFYDENDDLGRLYRKIKRADYDMPSPYWDNISKEGMIYLFSRFSLSGDKVVGNATFFNKNVFAIVFLNYTIKYSKRFSKKIIKP